MIATANGVEFDPHEWAALAAAYADAALTKRVSDYANEMGDLHDDLAGLFAVEAGDRAAAPLRALHLTA